MASVNEIIELKIARFAGCVDEILPVIASVAKAKLNCKDQRELDGFPAKIETVEIEQAEINTLLADGKIFQSARRRANEISKRSGELVVLIHDAMARWEVLG